MSDLERSPLGKPTGYSNRRTPETLFPIARDQGRQVLGIRGEPPFFGVDTWNGYEFSWLDPRGKPVVALATFHVPADSPAIIESKSFKLYLNGYSGERLHEQAVCEHLAHDLEQAAGAPVAVQLVPAAAFSAQRIGEPQGQCLDALDLDIDTYGPPQAAFLQAREHDAPVEETLYSHLFKSNCPVTGQPDWATVWIRYVGAPVDHAGLLRYLVSFREHRDFHEHCVERIYLDILRHCAPVRLEVCARFTRRGGLDINPFRSSERSSTAPMLRTVRQ